jgi:hypothetical protein
MAQFVVGIPQIEIQCGRMSVLFQDLLIRIDGLLVRSLIISLCGCIEAFGLLTVEIGAPERNI